MTLNLSYSSEMMTNHLQAELISPQKQFEALQTVEGMAALFAIDSSGAFNVIAEHSGSTVAGWTVTDLSSAQIARDFPAEATVSTFRVGQSVANGTFGLAMVVTSGSSHHLYLCLGNSSKDLSWTAAPNWTAYPYDDPANTLSALEIVGVYFCEPAGTTQYILVDVVRDPSSPVRDVERFLIDPTKANGHVWNSHDLPIDVEVGSYTSVVGRPKNGYVDGVYTAGTAGTSGQLVYLPIKNVFGPGPALPARLQLPSGAVPSAIAGSRNPDLSSDLFVVSGSTLFYFSSSNQNDGAKPVAILENDILSGTSQIASMVHSGVVTLWGRNGSDQVYSLSCPVGSVGTVSAWSVPLPVLSGIEQMSPYVNDADGGNTIFAAGSGAVERITRNTANGLWVTDQITLPASTKQPSISFNSYTTEIQVTGDDGMPAANMNIGLSADRRAGVYVNGTYYTVDRMPIHLTTRPSGTITIVEATDTLMGTTFTVSAGTGGGVAVNPMDTPFQKLAQLDTPSALTAATISYPDGTTRPLVPSGASADDLSLVANGLSQLATGYRKVSSGMLVRQMRPLASAPMAQAVEGVAEGIGVAIGDLFSWLESGVEAEVKVIADTVTDTLLFLAQVGDELYTAVIDSFEAVVGAAVWLFDKVKTAVEDLIKYVEFLFDWDDIKRTKDVLHNLIKQYLVGEVDELAAFKTKLDSAIGEVEQTVASWAGITDWSPIGESAGKPAVGSASNPMQGQSAASQHLNHHFQNNASSISVTGDLPIPDVVQNLIDQLFTVLANEGNILSQVIDQLGKLASDLSSLSVDQVLCRLAGILAEGVLGSAQAVIDVILDILIAVAETVVLLLDTNIYIPVVSDILSAIGVPEFSFLDLFCWIAAVGYTVVYKIAKGTAPFPDDPTTTVLSSASIDELRQAFSNPTPATPVPLKTAAALNRSVAATPPAPGTGMVPMPASVAEAVFIAGHSLGGFFALMSDFVSTFEAAEESGDNPWAIPSAVVGAAGGGCVGITNVLVPRDPIQNVYVSTASTITTVIRLIAKGLFSGPAQGKFKAATNITRYLAAGDPRSTGAYVDAVLTIPALACTGWHFYEIAEQSPTKERTDAILEEVSNMTSYISRVAYAVAVNDDDPESRAIEIGVMAVANLATAGLQTAEATVG
jgi:hypothetical protein